MYFGMFDPTIVILIPAMIFALYAQGKVKSAYNRYAQINNRRGITGHQAARMILDANGLRHVPVEMTAGTLTDHYDPRTKTVTLSDGVYSSTSVAAIGVAAHECGHAIQDNVGYVPLRMRAAFVPVVNFGSQLSWPLILIGLLIGGAGSTIVNIGIWMFVLVVLFQLITLPVELNASHRAVKLLDSIGILQGKEVGQTRKVLGAAALTYVAAAAASVLQLLRLIMLFGGRRDRDN